MAKFYGPIGYAESREGTGENEGIWTDVIVEHPYFGDEVHNTRRLETGVSTNDNLKVNTQLSIVADAYAWEHFYAMKYVEWEGVRWKISNVDVQRPRLILTLGDVWNGQQPS